jgi:hypothetical protein
MSISISTLPRPILAHRAAPARTMFTAVLPARLEQKVLTFRRWRAARHMRLAVEDFGHPGVLEDCQRATRN